MVGWAGASTDFIEVNILNSLQLPIRQLNPYNVTKSCNKVQFWIPFVTWLIIGVWVKFISIMGRVGRGFSVRGYVQLQQHNASQKLWDIVSCVKLCLA